MSTAEETDTLPAIDGPLPPTLWVNECTAIELSQGVVTLSFSEVRTLPSADGQGSVDRHVVSRLAMPLSAFNSIIPRVRRMNAARLAVTPSASDARN